MKNLSSVDRAAFPRPGKTPRDDTAAVMRFYKLPKAFSAEALAEAERCSACPPETEGRLDLRKKFIFTCDPETARDYDDALSVGTDREGRLVLGVHIADVSHYVRPGSALDREAARRSTSVYFADRVVPMLPEALSNGVCSLVPGEDRLAFSVFLTFDRNGEVVKRAFARSVIRSKARFTYADVMAVIRGDLRVKAVDAKAKAAILKIHALTRRLRARRFAAGALDLDIAEAEVVLDRTGRLESIVTRVNDESHQMIEECMVAANEAVAKELWTKGVRILARLHGAPEEEKLLMLRAELRGLGVKAGNLANPAVFARFLKAIRPHPLYPTLAMMVLRSMKRAVYDSTEIGHFGLAKKYYAHFTSPIRRYPDLTLHRQLAAFLEKREARVPPKTLAKWAARATEAEERATEAERALLEIKKFRFLEDQLQARRTVEYDAVVSKVMPFGCFVEIPEIATSGLVHVSHLSWRFVRFNESDQTLSAGGGLSWRIGDRLRVRVGRVDFDRRKIDFIPCSRPR